mgnify:CR=1 FL=1
MIIVLIILALMSVLIVINAYMLLGKIDYAIELLLNQKEQYRIEQNES